MVGIIKQPMREVRYSVAMSLDGYIAGPNGEYDWIIMDPDIDFQAMFKSFDTVLMGRKSYEAAKEHGGGSMPEMDSYVFSKTLNPADCPGVTMSDNPAETIAMIKSKPGKDLWLFGGGLLFRSFLDLGLVDAVEIAIIPVLLGKGLPMLPHPARRSKLRLVQRRIYEKTGTVILQYGVVRD